MRLLDRLLTLRGSTRTSALLRIALVGVAWSRWANELLLMRDLSPARIALSVAFFVCTAWLLVGLWTRAAALSTALVVGAIVFGFGHLGGVEDWTHHHTTLLAYAFFGLALLPCGGSFSADRWLAVRAAERDGQPPPPEVGDLWGLNVLAILVSTVYFWTAVDKTTVAFLSGARLEQIFTSMYTGSDWGSPPIARALFCLTAVAVTGLEYLLVFGLWVRRWQWWLVPAGLLMHGLFYALIPVYTFTVTMWSLYLVYLDPDAFHRFVDRLLGHDAPAPP